MGVPLAIGAVAALAALGTRRGSRSAPLPDWLSPLDARVVVEDGRPHWLFELPFISPRRLGGTVRVLFPMAGGDPLPPRGLVAQWGERVAPQAIADARRLLEGHPKVQEVRGAGLLVGVQCDEAVGPVVAAALDKGLLVVSAGAGDVLRLVPPLTVTRAEIDRAVGVIKAVTKTEK